MKTLVGILVLSALADCGSVTSADPTAASSDVGGTGLEEADGGAAGAAGSDGCAPPSVSFSFQLVRAGAPVSCDQADARTVRFRLGAAEVVVECSAASAAIFGVAGGAGHVEATFLAAGGATVFTGGFDVSVAPCGDSDAGNEAFAVP